MSLRGSYATTSVFGICGIEKSSKQRQCHRLPSHCTTSVCDTFPNVREMTGLPISNRLYGRPPPTPTTAFDRPNRLKVREEGAIKWVELLEKFKSVQERARRANRQHNPADDGPSAPNGNVEPSKEKPPLDAPKQSLRPSSAEGISRPPPAGHKAKSSLGNFSRLTGGVSVKKGKK